MRNLYTFNGSFRFVRSLFLFFVLIVSSEFARSQASAYTFSASSGTYTQVNDATATTLSAVQTDTYISPAQPIGFNFVYEGITYTEFKMSSNGLISLNTAGTSSLTGNDFTAANATSRPIIAPLWDDLDGRATGGSKALYEVTGSAPNRVLTVEWRNWEWNYSSTTPVISFQVKLYETSNKIEFIYRQESGSVNSGSASIGIGSATGSGNGSYLNLTSVTTPAVSSTTNVTNISTKPATGQVFTFTPPSCPPPSNITLSNITTTSATVSWNASATASNGYQYEVRTAGAGGSGTTGLVSSGNTTGLSVNLTALTPATSYTFYLRSDCGSGTTSAWTSVTFPTACNPVTTFPWTENFNATTIPDLPICFIAINNNNDADKWQTYDTYGVGGSNTAGLYTDFNAGANDDYLVLPAMTLTGNQRFRFSVRARSSGEPNDYKVVLSTTGTSPSDFNVELKPLTTVNSTTQTPIDWIDLSAYTGTVHLAIYVPSGGADGYYLYIDDLVVENIPSCDVPTAVTVNGITASGSDVNWADPVSGSPVSYQIYYSTTNTAPTASNTPNITNATSPATLTGLTANTTYYVWVRSFCGGTDVSLWSAVKSFTTLCNPISAFPWFENFNAVTVPALPSCFTAINNNNDADNWQTYDTYGVGGTNAAGLYTDYNAGVNDDYLVLPAMTLTGNQRFRFSVRARSSAEPNDYRVVLSTTGIAPADFNVVLKPLTTVNSTTQTVVDWIDLSAYTGTVYIAIHVPSGGADGYYLYVDDLAVENIPTCDVPTDVTFNAITTTSAEVNWTAPALGSPASYQIYYSTTNTAPTASTTPNVTNANAPATLTGLTANATYYVWVRSFCGGTDVSSWSAVASFNTLCNPFTSFPWTENFDAVTVPALPSCFTVINNNNDADKWQTYDTYGVGGTNAAGLYTDYNAGANDDYLVLPAMTLTGNQRFRFSVRARSTAEPNDYRVVLSTTGINASDFNVILKPLTTVSSTTQTAVDWIDLSAYTGTVYIAIHVPSGGADGYYLYVDNMIVENIPTCDVPTAIGISSVTNTSAQLNWSAPASSSPASYQVFYNTSGTAPTAGSTPNISNASSPTSLSGLSQNTLYYVWVRSFCGGTDVSAWSPVDSFRTTCDPITSLPWSEGFESLTSVGTGVMGGSCINTELVTGNNWTTANAPVRNSLGARTGSNYVWSRWSSDAWLYSPGLTLNAGTSYTFSFYYRHTDAVNGFTITTAVGQNAASADMTTVLGTITNPNNTTYLQATYNFIPSTTGVYYFGIHSVAPNTTPWYFEVDDIALSATVMPVTLINFNGEKAGEANRLFWSTATETNNKGFELQRSADGKNFTLLTFVSSRSADGNSNTRLDYSFADARPLGGNNYYRLKQVDKDGKFAYSDIILLKSKLSEIMISSLYPNPATDKLNLVVSSPSAEKLTIVITDLTGKVIMQKATMVAAGDNQQQLNVSSLAAGTYIVKAICANGCETAVHRFVKR